MFSIKEEKASSYETPMLYTNLAEHVDTSNTRYFCPSELFFLD